MPSTKRKSPDDTIDDDESVHPSRKRRVDNDEGRAELIKIFNDLRDEIASVRLGATKQLLNTLSSSGADRSSRIDYAVTRLVKGVCSGSKAARPGFSVALTEVLRLAFDKPNESSLTVTALVEKILALTNPEAKAKGEETRNYLLGRQFAFQAVLRSQILSRLPENDSKLVLEAIAELAAHKQWLRSECGAGLCGFLQSEKDLPEISAIARMLINAWVDKGLIKSPEGVALWITCRKQFPDLKFPKGIWHHNNPLAAQERSSLTKILLKNSVDDSDDQGNGAKQSGARQSAPNFAWTIVLPYLYSEDTKSFDQFWSECVAKPMFSSSSSTERKALGLQIFTKALATAPTSLLNIIVHSHIVQCILDQRVKSDRYLFEATKVPLQQMVSRSKSDSLAALNIVSPLLHALPGNIDKLTKSTVESLLAGIDETGLPILVDQISFDCWKPGSDDRAEADRKRRTLADALLTLVRSRRHDPALLFKDPGGKSRASNVAAWLRTLLETLSVAGYGPVRSDAVPAMSESTHEMFRERLMSALGQLVTLPLKHAIWPPFIAAEKLYDSRDQLLSPLSKSASKAVKDARKLQKEILEKSKGADASASSTMFAFHLLLSSGMLQLYKQEPDSESVLEDIISCHQSTHDAGDSSAVLVDLLLSFASKQSALFRKLAEQVFAAFSPEITGEALESMIDILGQKESIAGQEELFKQNDDAGEHDNQSDADSDGSIEQDSDVEIIDGQVTQRTGDSDSEDSDTDNELVIAEGDEDEEAAWDRKIAEALGTAKLDHDSDDDGSDMDDDQMMALDTHLTTIFTERKKGANRKKENQDARENIINFKNRVLDLLEIYVKGQYSNVIAIDLIMPLIELSRTTSHGPTAKKSLSVLESYFDACKKNKVIPTVEEDNALSLVKDILDDARQGGSKIHATACSRSSQFVAKILVSIDAANWRKVAGLYVILQDEWRTNPKTKIHSSMLNDWHNWSMQR